MDLVVPNLRKGLSSPGSWGEGTMSVMDHGMFSDGDGQPHGAKDPFFG